MAGHRQIATVAKLRNFAELCFDNPKQLPPHCALGSATPYARFVRAGNRAFSHGHWRQKLVAKS